MTCACGSENCTCNDQCLCYSCTCICSPCLELRRNRVCNQCGHRLDCILTKFPYPMPLPDLSFLNNPLPSGGASGEPAKPDEPGKPVSKVLNLEEKNEDFGEPMMFQMDDMDSLADERVSGSVDKVAPRLIAIGSDPNPRVVSNESVSEQVSDTSLPPLDTSSKDSESLPSDLSDESSHVPSPESPKVQLATSAPSFSASPRIHLSPVRSASAVAHLKSSTSQDMGSQSARHMHEMDIASDTSSSIETIPVSNEFCLEERLANFRISESSFVPDETATRLCASAEPTQLTESGRMSPKEHSTAISISNSRFKIEVVSDSSSIETCTETTSLDEESPV